MANTNAKPKPLSAYLVELATPDSGWTDVQALSSTARTVSDRLRREGVPVRFLRCVFVPEDESCLLVYRGASAQSVRAAASAADFDVRRVTPALGE